MPVQLSNLLHGIATGNAGTALSIAGIALSTASTAPKDAGSVNSTVPISTGSGCGATGITLAGNPLAGRTASCIL